MFSLDLISLKYDSYVQLDVINVKFQLRVDGYKWSTPFSVSNEGAMRISLKSDTGSNQLQLRVAVRGGTKSSRYEVIFRLNSFSSPYRLYLKPNMFKFFMSLSLLQGTLHVFTILFLVVCVYLSLLLMLHPSIYFLF